VVRIAEQICWPIALAAGNTGVVTALQKRPEKKEKQSIHWQTPKYGKNARAERMPPDAAKCEIDHGAD